MNLLELIEKIGVDKIRVQTVQSSMVKCVDKKRTKDTEVTIATNETTTTDMMSNTGKVGIVMWISRDDYNKHL